MQGVLTKKKKIHVHKVSNEIKIREVHDGLLTQYYIASKDAAIIIADR